MGGGTKNDVNNKGAAGGGNKGGAGGGKKKAALKDAHMMLSLALSGRTPKDGDIMSIGLCVFTPADTTIHGVRQWNLTPQHARPFSNVDVCGFWNGKPEVVDRLMRDRVPAAQACAEILEWLGGYGGKVTLVGNPLMSLYGFWAELFQQHGPTGGGALPWGFSGVCAKSFCSGVIGAAVKDLAKHPTYVAWHEGMATTSVPGNDAAVGAIVYCHASAAASAATAVSAPAAAAAADAIPSAVAWACERPACLDPVQPLGAVSDDVAGLDFVEYPKITDVDFADAGAMVASAGIDPATEWIASEKVHGANLSLWSDGKAVLAGRRTDFLKRADGKGFFDFDRLAARVHNAMIAAFDRAAAVAEQQGLVDATTAAAGHEGPSRMTHAVVYGEIAGGEYQHAAVPTDIRGRRVQAGVQYASTNFFYVFDVAVRVVDPAAGAAKLVFLPTTEIASVFPSETVAACDGALLVAQPLATGSFAEVAARPADFQSTIPAILGLPQLATPNFAEGLVIRPVRDVRLAGGKRVIFKHKHPMFKEFQSAGAADLPRAELFFSLITKQRVASVASKHTADVRDNDAALADLVRRDAESDAAELLAARGEEDPSMDTFVSAHRDAIAQSVALAIAAFRAA